MCAPAAIRKLLRKTGFLKSFLFSHKVVMLPVHLEGDDAVTIDQGWQIKLI
jgi:hypothetical protein